MTLGERCDEIIRLIDEAVGCPPPVTPRPPASFPEPAPLIPAARPRRP